MVQNLFNDVGTDLVDYRTPVVVYLHDPSAMVDKSIRQVSFKYAMVNDELYRRTAKDLLLKCLDTAQAKVAMGVHKAFVVCINWLQK